MSAFLMLLYVWACFLFGLWYFYNRTFRSSKGDERCLGTFFVSLFLSWWYWPLMIFYLIQEVREEKRKEIETIKRRAG